jgi:hypothetical protein
MYLQNCSVSLPGQSASYWLQWGPWISYRKISPKTATARTLSLYHHTKYFYFSLELHTELLTEVLTAVTLRSTGVKHQVVLLTWKDILTSSLQGWREIQAWKHLSWFLLGLFFEPKEWDRFSSSKMLVYIYQTTWHYIPEDRTRQYCASLCAVYFSGSTLPL